MLESDLLPRNRCEEIFALAAAAAREMGIRELEGTLAARDNALTRFANSTIHQNVAERSTLLSVRVLLDGRTARATTNRLDRDSVRRAVEEAAAIARVQERDPDLPSMAAPEPLDAVDRQYASVAATTPQDRANAVAGTLAALDDTSLSAAGIYATNQSALAILNTRGVFAYHSETLAQFSITVTAPDSSGWAKASSANLLDIRPLDLALRAAGKARAAAGPRELPPGRYTVILEPPAVLDLVGQMFGDFSATAMRDGRSFLAGRLGAKLFGDNITIHDDVYHPLQTGQAFDGEGLPRKRLTLVEKGAAKQVACGRYPARVEGEQSTGHGFPLPSEIGEAPMNIVFEGGPASVEELIASTDRGILVTRLWYIREVDPYEKIMTGMTRDGTFLIEDGRIRRGLRNFRFNQSLVELLSNVEALSTAQRTSGEEVFDMVVPAMKVREFNFTEATRF